VALLVSLALALTFTPALAAAVEGGAVGPGRSGPGDRLADRLAAVYARGLPRLLRHRGLALAAAGVVLVIAAVAYRHIETGFVPLMDEGAFVLDFWSPPGTSLTDTELMLAVVDDTLQATPEVEAFARRTGAEMGFFLTETNRGDYAVRLRPDRSRSAPQVMEALREQLRATAPGLRVEFVQILQDMIGDLSGNPSPVEVKLFGEDQSALEQTAAEAGRRVAAVPGAADVFDGIVEVGPTYQVDVDARRAAQVGLDAGMVQHWLETAITGSVVGQVLEADRAIPLRLRGPDALRDRLDGLGALTLPTAQGGLAPLAAVARLASGPAVVQRQRENLRQLVRVTANLDGRDLGSVTRDVRAVVTGLALPPGVTLEYGGLYASQQQSFTELLLVFLAALASMSVLLLMEFGSVAAAVAIVAGSAMAVCGSLLALWLTGIALNVSSFVGMVMVVGIVAKNGILLLDFADRARARGADLVTGLSDAGRVRLRPILMTSLAAAAGLMPLALGIGAGGEMQQPLAVAILGGLAFSMLCSLIGVPLLYAMLTRPAEATHAPVDR